MSRSKHQTVKSVFGGLSKAGVSELANSNDEDLKELVSKKRLKREVREQRQDQKAKL